jgi:hypothetical protein
MHAMLFSTAYRGNEVDSWASSVLADDPMRTRTTVAAEVLFVAGALGDGPAGHGQRVTERPEIR